MNLMEFNWIQMNSADYTVTPISFWILHSPSSQFRFILNNVWSQYDFHAAKRPNIHADIGGAAWENVHLQSAIYIHSSPPNTKPFLIHTLALYSFSFHFNT